jgi:hypothetical protein
MWRSASPLVPGLGHAHHHHTHTTEALVRGERRERPAQRNCGRAHCCTGDPTDRGTFSVFIKEIPYYHLYGGAGPRRRRKKKELSACVGVARAVWSGRCWLRVRCCCAALLVLC